MQPCKRLTSAGGGGDGGVPWACTTGFGQTNTGSNTEIILPRYLH